MKKPAEAGSLLAGEHCYLGRPGGVIGVIGRGSVMMGGDGLAMGPGRGSLYDPVLANAGAAARVSTAGGIYAAFLTNSLRD